jgi:uncharacterized membrane protein
MRRAKPEVIFAVFAVLFGLIFCALIPPLGGGNETFNFSRVVSVAYGHMLVGDISVPSGLVRLIQQAGAHFTESATLPLGYKARFVGELAVLKLDAGMPGVLAANPIAVLNPLAYMPQAAVVRAAALFGVAPLPLFYAARLTGLACAVLLTYWAIRQAPSHKYLLCAIALLPPLTFSRSTVDADQVTTALAFLFVGSVWRAIVREDAARPRELGWLAAMAFVIAQCKGAYVVLPLLVLAIPAHRFAGGRARLTWLAVLIVPGAIADAAYMLALKYSYFAGLSYHTWAGQPDPSRQLALILHDPFLYARVLARTVFATGLIPLSVLQMLGTFGPPLTLPGAVIVTLAALMGVIVVTDGTGAAVTYPKAAAWLAVLIAAAVLGIALTLLYIQWTGYAAPSVQGFQGRYLYPVLPVLMVFLRATRRDVLGIGAAGWVLALAGIGLGSASWFAVAAYYG